MSEVQTNKGKRYNESAGSYDRDKFHKPSDAISIVKQFAKAKFDETVEVAIQLGVNPAKADQIVRGTVSLPSGTGKSVRIAVFAEGEAATAAKEAGADLVGGAELVAEVEGGMMDFDLAISTPELMPQVGKLGRALGPRGLMPNPKTGTVTPDPAKAVGNFKGGMVEYRTDKDGNIHVAIGKASFDEAALAANFGALVSELTKAKPASAKGRYYKRAALSSTMGPGVKIDTSVIDEL